LSRDRSSEATCWHLEQTIASPSPRLILVRIALLFMRIGVIDVHDRGNRRERRLRMKTFTIDAQNHITVFASKKEAAAASATDPFASQEELAELTADWPARRSGHF
jgi:hypothetical protein